MSEEHQQSLEEHSYEVITFLNTVPLHPPVPHHQATMPQDHANDIFVVPPPVGRPAYCDPHRVGYAQYYGPMTPGGGTTHIHRYTPCVPQPIINTNQLNNIAPTQPFGSATATSHGPPFLDIPFGLAVNTPVPSGTSMPRRLKRTRQDFNDADYNATVPGTSMANIYRDLAVRFINDPQSNIIIIRMESSAGRSRVMVELEIVDAA